MGRWPRWWPQEYLPGCSKKKHVHERAVAPYVAVAVVSSRVLVAAAESLPW